MNDKAIIQWLIPILLRLVELFVQLVVIVFTGVVLYALFNVFIGPGILAIGGTKIEFLLTLLVIIFTLQLMGSDNSNKE